MSRLALTPGTRLGVYEVLAQIGEGGMGQVFRARDTRLNRDVALKVLPDSFANDADRLARFTREAQTLAALNHPNIAAIYGLEEGPSEGGGVQGRWSRNSREIYYRGSKHVVAVALDAGGAEPVFGKPTPLSPTTTSSVAATALPTTT